MISHKVVEKKGKLIKVNVYLDSKLVGHIQHLSDGWRYFPKGSKKGGEKFPTLQQCKNSL